MGIKREELATGCIAKAADDEPVFVLRAQDITAPAVVRTWCEFAVLAGCAPEKIREARALALQMEQWPNRKMPD